MEILVSDMHNIFFIVDVKIILTTTINDLIARVLISVGHLQVTERITDVSVLYLLTCL